MSIHASHQPEARRAIRAVSVLLMVLLLIYAVPFPESAQSIAHYLPLHMALETLAVSIAGLIFAIIWSARNEQLPRNTLLLGCAFLGVALLDFGHMLSYQGMSDFVTASSPHKAINFWLAARLFSALALLAVVLLPWSVRSDQSALRPLHVLALVLVSVSALYILFLFYPQLLPATFIDGQGLTDFKIGFEYTLMGLNLIAAAVLLWHMRRPKSFNASGLFAAVAILAQSEFFFTLYGNVTDVYNLGGHIYKVLAYGFFYRAIFIATVQSPYEQLRTSRGKLQALLDALPDVLLEVDDQGRYLQVHSGHSGNLAAPADKMLGKTLYQVLPPENAKIAYAALAQAQQHGFSRGHTMCIDTPAGQRWFELSVTRQAAPPAGQRQRFVVISRNITERLHQEASMRKLSQAVSQSPLPLVITDMKANIEFVNEAFVRSCEYSEAELIGQNPRILQSGKTPAATYRNIWAQLQQGKPWQGEVTNRSKSGREYIESVLIYPVRNAQGNVTHYLAHKEDMTERKQAAAHIRQLSHYDQLTGLPNRAMLRERFQYAISQGQMLALLWVDLDRFKDINDALGHSAGDALLLEVSLRLRSQLGAEDTLSRHSGDDFVALLAHTSQSQAAQRCIQLLESLNAPVLIAGQEVFLTASIGIAITPGDGDNLESLLKNAENAMYRVKDEGRNSYRFFTAEMQAHSARALTLGNALKQALHRDELHLVYQPQMSLADGSIVGAEALLRWIHPHLGFISPGEFIPLAEANGLIVPIGEWVLQTALRQMRHWRDQGLPLMTIAVNISAVQFEQPGLVGLVRQLLKDTGIPPEGLELELTEAVAMKAPETVAKTMKELGQQGVRLSIDDFGTGYSSLSYLKRFNIHKLKIDQSFVRDISADPDDQAIATAIVQMAHSLGMSTIAEGVETAEQLDFLRLRGCDQIQGYYFSRPLLPAVFAQFVQDNLNQNTALKVSQTSELASSEAEITI
ncbi:MAG: EAL domain-containing protein [Giesbergeria sp.]|nr:EAL domain-containing protein [Giesbergeria sp.]